MQPLPDTLTQAWLPSESIACRIKTPDPKLDFVPKYFLIEVDDWTNLAQPREELASLSPDTKIAFFGPDTLAPPPTGFQGHPCLLGPQSLDDLVERLDARPASDWADAKSALRQPAL